MSIRRQLVAKKLLVLFAFVLAACTLAVVFSLNGTGRSEFENHIVQGQPIHEWFERVSGRGGADVVDIMELQALGVESVDFLAEQMKRRDSRFRAWYIALWPKLPKPLKIKLGQPVRAREFAFVAIGALRSMGTPYLNSDTGIAALGYRPDWCDFAR